MNECWWPEAAQARECRCGHQEHDHRWEAPSVGLSMTGACHRRGRILADQSPCVQYEWCACASYNPPRPASTPPSEPWPTDATGQAALERRRVADELDRERLENKRLRAELEDLRRRVLKALKP